MHLFYESHSRAEIALEAFHDAVWVSFYVIGYIGALWQHFTAPTVPNIDPHDIALPYSELTPPEPDPVAPTAETTVKPKAKRTRRAKAKEVNA